MEKPNASDSRPESGAALQWTRWDLWAGLLILATMALRLWFVASGQLNLVQDEAQYWDWSRTLQLSYYSKGPLIAVLIRLGTALLGDTELGVRAFAVLGAALLQAMIHLGASRLFGRPRLGFWTVVIADTMPVFLASSILMTTDGPLLICWMAALFSLYQASLGKWGPWPYRILAAAVALGVLAKYMMLAFLPTALVYSLVLHRRGGLPERYWPRLAKALALGAGLGFVPILAWNLGNGFVGYKHVAHLGGFAGEKARTIIRFDRFPEFFGSQVGLLTPWWLACMCLGGARAVRTALGRPGRGLDLDGRQSLLLAAGFWPLFGFFMVWSFHTKVLANWPAVSYGSGLVLAAAAWDGAWRSGRGFLGRHKKVWLALGCMIFILLHAQALLPLPERINPAMRLKGWSDLGDKVAQLRRDSFHDPDRVFLFGSNYDVTAELSFYVPGRDGLGHGARAYCIDLGRRRNQYDLWPGPQDKAGWDAVYVVKDGREEVEPAVRELFDRVERIEYRSMHHGRPGRLFTIFLCHGFTGQWPRAAGADY